MPTAEPSRISTLTTLALPIPILDVGLSARLEYRIMQPGYVPEYFDQTYDLGRFQYFAPGPVVSHAYIRVEQAGVPVSVGGLRVEPGDMLFGDRHCVLLIPQEIAAELPEAANRIVEREQKLIGWVRSDDFSLDRLSEMRQVKH